MHPGSSITNIVDPDFDLNLRVKLHGHTSPLKINFTYLATEGTDDLLRHVHVYLSLSAKEPTADRCLSSYVNPKQIVFEAEASEGATHHIFNHIWLYIGIKSRS